MTIRIRVLSAVLAACAAVLWAAVGPAPSAAAHPFGPPSTATISAEGPRATIVWRAAEDDWVALGQSLGAFEDPDTKAVSTALTGEQKLQRSSDVRAYLLDRIGVSQDGAPCVGELASLNNLLAEGARLTYECPRDIREVDVTVGALADLNQAYRTMLTASTPATPERTLLTAKDTREHLDFSSSAGLTGAAGVATGTLAVLAGAVVFMVIRKRRAGRERRT